MTKENVGKIIKQSIQTKQFLVERCVDDIHSIGLLLSNSLSNGNKILLCGNGGSAADAQHIAAELVIRYRSGVERKPLPAIALTTDSSMLTAGGNDYGFDNIFARATEAYGQKGDVLVAISTSGNSENVLRAVSTANRLGMISIGLLGCEGGKIARLCFSSVIVPSDVTARIQECHITIGHIWCEMIEEFLFPDLTAQKS
jgi:D-sedoheptulose 7-phosphate isomerase